MHNVHSDWKQMFLESINMLCMNVPVSFGKFCVKEKQERRERNPSIGEDMMIDP